MRTASLQPLTSTFAPAAILLCCALIAAGQTSNTSETLHTFLLLDRSGSMHQIRDDMTGSLNSYLTDLQTSPHAHLSKLTLAQFDSQNPFELIHDATNCSAITLLGEDEFKPRAATPLFDAIGSMITHAQRRADILAELRASRERVVVVVLTDGEENSSRQYDRAKVAQLVKNKEQEGWTFVFLGANIDAYAEGGGVGISAQNTQNFAFDGEGVKTVMRSLSRAHIRYEEAIESQQLSGDEVHRSSQTDYFGGVKEAEMDYQQRGPGSIHQVP